MIDQGETKAESRGPYVIYCRRSTDEENKQKDSVSAQIKACIDYWERSGNFDLQQRTEALDLPLFNIDGELQKERDRTDAYHEYLEKVKGCIVIIERASAKSSKQRKKRTKLVNLASKGKIKGILSYSPDRCSRNMLEAGELIDLVDNTDLDLKFTNFHFEKTPSGKMMLAVLFGFAKHYSDNRSVLSKRGHSNKGNRGEALGASKYGYIINDAGCFEPHPKYRDLMQMAFTMKVHQGVSDIKIAKWLNDEGFKVWAKVGKRAKEYGKMKFKEHKIRASNLGPMWLDPFYYGVLLYGEGRYDQRDLNASYGQPMITESDHNILVGRSNAELISSKRRETKDGNDLLRPFPIGMVVTERGDTIHGGPNNLKRDHQPRLKKLQETLPESTLVDVIDPRHIKYSYKKDGLSINVTAESLIAAALDQLSLLKQLEKHYEAYCEYVKNMSKVTQKELSEKRQIQRMSQSRKETELNSFIEENLSSLGSFGPKEREVYNNKKSAIEKEILDISAVIYDLEQKRKNDITAVTSIQFFKFMKDASKYYRLASYVQKAQIATIFFSNVIINDDMSLAVRVNPMLEQLFSGMVGNTGFEPVTSAMSMQRSRQLS